MLNYFVMPDVSSEECKAISFDLINWANNEERNCEEFFAAASLAIEHLDRDGFYPDNEDDLEQFKLREFDVKSDLIISYIYDIGMSKYFKLLNDEEEKIKNPPMEVEWTEYSFTGAKRTDTLYSKCAYDLMMSKFQKDEDSIGDTVAMLIEELYQAKSISCKSVGILSGKGEDVSDMPKYPYSEGMTAEEIVEMRHHQSRCAWNEAQEIERERLMDKPF